MVRAPHATEERVLNSVVVKMEGVGDDAAAAQQSSRRRMSAREREELIV